MSEQLTVRQVEREELKMLRAEVERLEAAHANAVELLHEANLAGTTVTGMEQAAKKLEHMARATQPAHDIVLLNNAAAAIRAEKECGDE